MPDVLVTVGGRLVGAQRWSIGFCFELEGGSTPPPDTAMGTFANQAFTDWVNTAWSATTGGGTAIAAQVGSRGNFDSVRAYFHPSPASQAGVIGVSTTAAVAGSGTQTQPPQCAIVATLLTGLAGRSNRGRVYLPGGASTDTNGVFTSTLATGLATSIANFLSAVATRSINGNTLTPVVSSATRNYYTPISSVRVDNVVDTQRRRRDKVSPTASPVVTVVVP